MDEEKTIDEAVEELADEMKEFEPVAFDEAVKETEPERKDAPILRALGDPEPADMNMIHKHMDNFLAMIAGETPVDSNVRNSTEYWLKRIAESGGGGGGGGSAKYTHHLRVRYSHTSTGAGDPTKNASIYFSIETDNPEPIETITDLLSAMTAFDYLHELMATGYYNQGTDAYTNPIIDCYCSESGLTIGCIYFTGSSSLHNLYLLSDLNGYTIRDVVK